MATMPRGTGEVSAFALLMHDKLRENAHKGGWGDVSVSEVLERLREEMEELELEAGDLIVAERYGTDDAEWLANKRRMLAREAADVGNYLMILCDVAGALEEGR